MTQYQTYKTCLIFQIIATLKMSFSKEVFKPGSKILNKTCYHRRVLHEPEWYLSAKKLHILWWQANLEPSIYISNFSLRGKLVIATCHWSSLLRKASLCWLCSEGEVVFLGRDWEPQRETFRIPGNRGLGNLLCLPICSSSSS